MHSIPSRRYAVDSLPPGFRPQKPDLTNSQPNQLFTRTIRFIMYLMRLMLFMASIGAYFLLSPTVTLDAAGPDNPRRVAHHIPDDTSANDVLVELVKYVVDSSPLAGKLDIVRQTRSIPLTVHSAVKVNLPTRPLQTIADIFVASPTPQLPAPADATVQVNIVEPVVDEPLLAALPTESAILPEINNLAEPPVQADTPAEPEPMPQPAADATPAEQSQAIDIDLPEVTPNAGIQHIVLISIDGLRPDALDLANTPVLDNMRREGAYCPHAQTVDPSLTLPSHASMLSGMVPDKHGIHWNAPYIGWPGMTGPTVFNILQEVGLTSAMVYGKDSLNYIVLPNGADIVFGDNVHDPVIRDEALKMIEAGLPNLLFVHFPDTDRVGHDYGWMSENQLYAINFVDGLIGELRSAVENKGYNHNTLWIVTSDHGGHGFGHGDDSPLDRTIPWLATGSGVFAGITVHGELNTYDTAATILYAFDIPIPELWDGKPVLGIFNR